MNSVDTIYAACYDCEAELSARETVRREVPMDLDSGGYEFVPVPICRRCDLKRNGHACEHCGELHPDIEAAYHCCRDQYGRLAGEAPDCPECDRRMQRGSWGYHPVHGQTVEWAECECCPVAWGKYTGWHQTDDEPCKHVEMDPRGDSA